MQQYRKSYSLNSQYSCYLLIPLVLCRYSQYNVKKELLFSKFGATYVCIKGDAVSTSLRALSLLYSIHFQINPLHMDTAHFKELVCTIVRTL